MIRQGAFVSIVLLVSSVAFATGYEKATTWSGRFAPMGGTGVSLARQAEALYFNPAGLASEGGQVALNFSPTFTKFSGPFSANTSTDGTRKMSPVTGITASYGLSPDFGFGIGYYVSGGAKAVYENINTPAITGFKGTIGQELAITEWALGVGYQLLPGLRFGAAWRIVHADATVRAIAGANTIVNFENMSGTRYNGYKLGLQYDHSSGLWGIGMNWRSSVEFLGKGTTSVTTSTGTTSLNTGSFVSSSLPWQADVGAYYNVTPELRLVPGYTFTNYAIVGLGINSVAASRNWRNQHNVRLGSEYQLSESSVLRAGYVLSTQVVPNSDATVDGGSPGAGHTFSLGAGMKLTQSLGLDGGLEYGFAKGSGAAPAVSGVYKSDAYAIHTGGTYNF